MAKILVVEDEPIIRDLLTRILALDRYEVIVAIDGRLGVLHAYQDRPDLIIMDVGLPVLNGIQATQQIRAIPHQRQTPIIALTAFASEETRIECLQAGCDLYQAKPIDLAELRQNIRTLLQGTK